MISRWLKTGLPMAALTLLSVQSTYAVPQTEHAPQKASHFLPAGFEHSHSPQLLAARQERRTALVIGNGNYAAEGRLNNPLNDAADVAQALRELGFEVTLLKDASKKEIETAIDRFNSELRQGGVGLFYFAGHGVQINGENYLIPVKANIRREGDVQYEAVPLGKIIAAMEDAENPINFLLIDACRNNPYSRTWRSVARGLAPLRSTAKGMLVSFATAPGKLAADGLARNSPYTRSLLKHIQTPGIPVEILFRNVRNSVVELTQGKQTPWESTSLTGNFEFKPVNDIDSPVATIQADAPAPLPSNIISDVLGAGDKTIVEISQGETDAPDWEALFSSPDNGDRPTLVSQATGVSYELLRNLLTQGKWKEADKETDRVILEATGRTENGWVSWQEIDSLDCEDLRIVDELWLAKSDGKFGLSVQSEIYRSLGGTRFGNSILWDKFSKIVGYKKGEKWLSKSSLDFDLFSSKAGQLPTFAFFIDSHMHGTESYPDFGNSSAWLLSKSSECSL